MTHDRIDFLLPYINEENIDDHIDKLSKATAANNEDILDELFDDADIYETLFEKVITELRNQTANCSSFVHSAKCAAHTVQLAVKDALNLLSKKDKNVIDLCREVAKV